MKRGKTYIAHDINILFIDCFNCLLLQRNHQSDPNAAVHNHLEIFVHFDADMAVYRVGHIRHSDAHPYHLWTVSGKHYINDIFIHINTYLVVDHHSNLLKLFLVTFSSDFSSERNEKNWSSWSARAWQWPAIKRMTTSRLKTNAMHICFIYLCCMISNHFLFSRRETVIRFITFRSYAFPLRNRSVCVHVHSYIIYM